MRPATTTSMARPTATDLDLIEEVPISTQLAIGAVRRSNNTTTASASTSEIPNNRQTPDHHQQQSSVREQQAAVAPPVWPDLDDKHPLAVLGSRLGSLFWSINFNDCFDVTLINPPDFYTKLVLQKFLRANANNVDKAYDHLLATLKWRGSFNPRDAAQWQVSRRTFGGLGYVVPLGHVPGSLKMEEVVIFNIHGAVEDPEETFGDMRTFLRWRVGLMELAIRKLDLQRATQPIPDYGKGPDPYQIIEIHDYHQASYLRPDQYTKAARQQASEIFKNYYPEFISEKYLVNVPVWMDLVFNTISVVLKKERIKKSQVLRDGRELSVSLGCELPPEYGGRGESLEGRGIALPFHKPPNGW